MVIIPEFRGHFDPLKDPFGAYRAFSKASIFERGKVRQTVNPVRARLVEKPADWSWSGARAPDGSGEARSVP